MGTAVSLARSGPLRRGPAAPSRTMLWLVCAWLAGCDTSPTPHPGTPDGWNTPDVTETGGNDTATAVPDTDPPDTDLPDGDPSTDPDSDSDPELPTEPATVAQLADGPWRWVIVVGPQTLLASDGDQALWIVGDTFTPIAAEAISATADAPPFAALSASEILVGGDRGLVRLVHGVVTASPLSDRFTEPVAALGTSDHALWLTTDDGLFLWRDRALTPITGANVELADNLLAPLHGGTWLAGPHGVSRLTLSPSSLTLERPSLTDVRALGRDADGHLYALADVLHVRLPDGRWLEAAIPQARALATHPEARAAWVAHADGTLTRGAGTAFARITGLPAFSVRHLAAHADGRVVLATDLGLYEVASSRTVSLPPLPSPLDTPLTVSVRASDAALVTAATAATASLDLTVTFIGEGAERRPTIHLDPRTLPNGAHTLTITLTWADGDTVTTSTPLTIDQPTWAKDIAPFYDRQCKDCHAADNGGNFASLHTPDRWSQRMAEILCRIDQHDPSGHAPECTTLGFEVASMPPGRTIPSPQVDLLRKWRDAGFRP